MVGVSPQRINRGNSQNTIPFNGIAMDRFKLYQTFIAVAEETSFSGASRRTGMSSPAVTRAIQLLEQHVGAKLFNRNTRVVKLTEGGTRFYADAKRILGEIGEAETAVSGTLAEPRGQVSVTASATFGRLHVAPIIGEFLQRHLQMTARVVLVDRVVDLIEEGFDVAIRIAHLPDSSLRATQVGTVRRVVCASPKYLAEHGAPRSPTDLNAMQAVNLPLSSQQQQWSFNVAGRSRAAHPTVRLTANTVEVAVEAVVAGLGIARLLSYQVADEVRRGALKIILAEFEPLPVPVHVVYLDATRAGARVRAFVDFAVARLKKNKAIQ
jgi:DNA-binding transcriptional LysR family regulator